MKPATTLLSVAALGAVAGCSSYDPYYSSTPNPNPPVAAAATPAATYRLGTGVVQSVALLPTSLQSESERASASTGGSIPSHAGYRLSIRMDDGTVQVVDQDNRDFQVGDRVRITGSGRVIRY